MKTLIPFVILLLSAFALQGLFASTGEVSKTDNTWTSTIDGDTVYQGTDMIDAINACTGNMSSGTINVRNSGIAVAPSGLRQVNLYSNQTIDFQNDTMVCENPLNIYPVKADGQSNVTVKNLRVEGVPRYILHFNDCSGITLSNITAHTTRGTGIRVQNSSNLVIKDTIIIHSPGHCIETYTVDSTIIGTVHVQSDNGCGVLFNDSWKSYVDTIYAKLCSYGETYAGFRQANNNGTTYCKYLRADSCGRGLYTLSGSSQVTVDSVYITNCSASGISPAGTASEVYVNSGTVTNCNNKEVDIWDGAILICIKVNGETYGDGCNGVPIGTTKFWHEAECGEVGDSWELVSDTSASFGTYVTAKPGKESKTVPPSTDGQIKFTFNANEAGKFNVWARTITPNVDDDSFWVQMDGDDAKSWNGIGPYTQWAWEKAFSYTLQSGSHTLTIGYREDGAKLDKIFITNTDDVPIGQGDTVTCDTTSKVNNITSMKTGNITLYPNPVVDFLNIKSDQNIYINADLQIFTLSGALVKNIHLNNNSARINLSELNAGIYFIQYNINNTVERILFLKK